jgi:hypothetical protein
MQAAYEYYKASDQAKSQYRLSFSFLSQSDLFYLLIADKRVLLRL